MPTCLEYAEADQRVSHGAAVCGHRPAVLRGIAEQRDAGAAVVVRVVVPGYHAGAQGLAPCAVCRSPMAEAIFNALTEDGDLPLRAASAGVAALLDEEMAPNSRAALEEVGIHAGVHRARQVDESMLRETNLLVLAMSPRQVETLRRRLEAPSGQVYTLPEYALGASPQEGIPDPYGHTMTTFRASVRQLLDCVNGLVGRLEREGALQ